VAPSKAQRPACSIEELKKLIVGVEAMHPPAAADEIFNTDRPKDTGWSIWDGEFDTPTSIVVRLTNHYGELMFRVSFLSQRDYVISETQYDYPDHVFTLLDKKRPITV